MCLIDDVMGMASCCDESIELNALINAKMESKKLILSQDKIQICKSTQNCLQVHDYNMKTVSQVTYLGDVVSETGRIDGTIKQISQKAIGIIRYHPCYPVSA